MKDDLEYRLLERARIRRQIPTRKSVQEGAPDRIADLLEEAALAIKELKEINFNRFQTILVILLLFLGML